MSTYKNINKGMAKSSTSVTYKPDGHVVCSNCGCVLHGLNGNRYPVRRQPYHGPLSLHVMDEFVGNRWVASKILFVGNMDGHDYIIKSITIKETFGVDHARCWKTQSWMPYGQIYRDVSDNQAAVKSQHLKDTPFVDVTPVGRQSAVSHIIKSGLKGSKFERAIKSVMSNDVFDIIEYAEEIGLYK